MKHPHKVINIIRLRKKAMKLHRKTNEKFIFIGTFLSLSFSLGGSTGENDLWQGLKAPSTYHDQRSKFRQQASPYVRPT